MAYKVLFRDDARKTFERLDRAIRQQVGRVIDRLAENPRPGAGNTTRRRPANVAIQGR